ncbi:MAG: hypothetical protein FD123_1601 [Bacteroidetes bacterium]|nr:MAG: hypothetical protein FD123_1601 [Bacteroidota bacterium]
MIFFGCRLSLFVFIIFYSFSLSAQQDTLIDRGKFSCGTRSAKSNADKGLFYIAWGYNANRYSKSTLHFFDESGDYDFTLHKMTARDRPQLRDIFRVQPSIPQYGYRMGYYFPQSDWGVEMNFDHAKYIVNDYQTVRLTGRIGDLTFDKDTLVDPGNFMHLEHTDGANFLLANIMRRWQLAASPGQKLRLSGILKAGAGIVIPRSNVILWGVNSNRCFHIAGQIAGVETGARLDYYGRYFVLFLEATAKGSLANFNKVLGVGDGLVSHRFATASLLLHGGLAFPLGRKN